MNSELDVVGSGHSVTGGTSCATNVKCLNIL